MDSKIIVHGFYEKYPKQVLYQGGLPFTPELATNLVDIDDRVRKRKASMIIIDGGVGEGKTTLATHCADYLQANPIEFLTQLGLGGEDFTKKLRVCAKEKLKVVIYDEAGDFNRKGAISRFNLMMNRVFETYRTFQVIVIAILPSFYYLDNQLFDNKIPRLLLHCKGRTEKYGTFQAYSLYRMMYLREKMKKMVVKEHAFNVVEPNFYGRFRDLPPSRSNELDKISTESKMKTLERTEIQVSGLFTYKDFLEKSGKSIATLRRAFAKMKIKPAKKIGRTNFYTPESLNLVLEEMSKEGEHYEN